MLSERGVERAKRVLKYMYRFGSIRGLRMVLQFRARNECVGLRLPGYHAPVFLRPGTSDVPTFEQVFISREYDFPYPNEAPRLIIDAGAHVGLATLFFVKRFPKARVLAVEPEGSNYELLLRNTRPYSNVTALRAALWGKSAQLRIANPSAEFWAFRVIESSPTCSSAIQGMTIPELMALAGTDAVDILKVDIEGAEKEVFESNVTPWLDRVGVIVIELHDSFRPGCSRAFYRATTQLRFRQFHSGENVVLVREARRCEDR